MSNRQFYQRLGLGIFLALLGISGVNRPAISQEPLLVPPEGQPQPDNVQLAANNEQVEVLTRGPVHEAFAESVQLDPKSDLVVKKQPPQPIEEVPPDVKPAGDNIAWIPGYWSWDDTRNDFLWVSGVYRATPPNRTWVPGYFAQAETGWKWTPGFWAQAAAQHVEYLPQPPATLETGPTSDSPGADHYWVSGCWIHRGGHYAWRPGYWTVVNPNWIWIPDHYAWTPCGYVFVPGYWDYPMTYRGTIFAPVCFHQEVHLRPTFVYRPAVVLDVGVLSVHLWNRPHHCHYYFGDYYEATYVGLGYSPWFVSYTSYHGCYDPMFNYYRCVHHDEPRWSINIQVQHNFYREHHHHRPPATYVAQADYARRMQNDPHTESTIVPIGGRRGTKVGSAMMGASLADAVEKKNVTTTTNFERIKPDTHQQLTSSLKDVRAAGAERSHHESGGVKIGKANVTPPTGSNPGGPTGGTTGGATAGTATPNATGQAFSLKNKRVGGVKLNADGAGVSAMNTNPPQTLTTTNTTGNTTGNAGTAGGATTSTPNNLGNPSGTPGRGPGHRALGGANNGQGGGNNAQGGANNAQGGATGTPSGIATGGNNPAGNAGANNSVVGKPPSINNPTGGNPPVINNPTGGNPATSNVITGNATPGNAASGNHNPPHNPGGARVVTGGNPNVGNPSVGNLPSGNPTSGKPATGNPISGNPAPGNSGHANPSGGNPNTGKPLGLNPGGPALGPGVGVAPRIINPTPRNTQQGGDRNSNKGKNDDKGKSSQLNLQPDAQRIVTQPSFTPVRERAANPPTLPKTAIAGPSGGKPNIVATSPSLPKSNPVTGSGTSQPNPTVTSRITLPAGQARANSKANNPSNESPKPDDSKKKRDRFLGR